MLAEDLLMDRRVSHIFHLGISFRLENAQGPTTLLPFSIVYPL